MKVKQLVAGMIFCAMLFTLMPELAGSSSYHSLDLTRQEIQEIRASADLYIILNKNVMTFFEEAKKSDLIDDEGFFKHCVDRINAGFKIMEFETFIKALGMVAKGKGSSFREKANSILDGIEKSIIFIKKDNFSSSSKDGFPYQERPIYVCENATDAVYFDGDELSSFMPKAIFTNEIDALGSTNTTTFRGNVTVLGDKTLFVTSISPTSTGGTVSIGGTLVVNNNTVMTNNSTFSSTYNSSLTISTTNQLFVNEISPTDMNGLHTTTTFAGNVYIGIPAASRTLTTTGDVTINGQLTLTGQLSADNLKVTNNEIVGGNFSVSGNEVVGGTLGVTGAATLGNSLGVNGATTLANTLTVAGLSLLNGGSTVNGDVKVQGSGTVTVEEPTTFNASMSITGTNQLLVNEINQVVGGGTLQLGRSGINAGLVAVNTSGMTVSGPMTHTSTSSFNGNVTVGVLGTSSATLTTTGDVILHGNMNLDGQISSSNLAVSGSGIMSALNVTGNETVGGTLGVTGAATLGNSLGVNGATTLANTLTVAGLSLLNGGSTVNGDVKVQGSGTVTVEEPATFNASVSVTGTNQLLVNEVQQVNAGGTLNVGRTGASAGLINVNTTGMTVSGPMTHTNTSSFNGNVTVGVLGTSSATLTTTGDVIAHGNMSVDGQVSSSNLAVSGSGVITTLNVTGNETVGGTLGVTGATTLGNSLGVTGATTLANTLTVAGLSLLNGGSTVNGNLKVQGAGAVIVEEPATFNASVSVTGTNQLLVNEISQVVGGGTLQLGRTGVNAGLININTSGATVSGPLTLLSTSSFNGNVTVGVLGTSSATLTTTGDVITHGNMSVDGQISSSNLTVSGSGVVTTLNVTGNEAVGGTLGVTGATTLGNTLGVTGATTLANTLTVAGLSLLNGGSTVNGNVKVQGAGTVIVEEPATFNASVSVTGTNQLLVNEVLQVNAGGTLNVGRTGVNAGLININTSGATVSGPLTLLSTSSFNGNVTVGVLGTSSATLTTTGDVIVQGNMSVDGQISSSNLAVSGSGIMSALNVTGNETVGGTLGVTGAATLGSSLGVNGATTLANTLTVAGLSLLNGGSTVNGDVKVQGSGTVTVEEPTTFNASMSVTGTNQLLVNEVQQVNAGGTLNVGRTGASAGVINVNTTGMTVNGPMTHTSTSSFNGNVTVGVLGTSSATLTTTGDVIAHGNMSVDGQVTSGNLAVNGSGVMSALNVAGNETVGGTLGVSGATTLGNTLGVSGSTTLANTLTVAGLASLQNGAVLNGALTIVGNGGISVYQTSTFNNSMTISGTNQLLVNEICQTSDGTTLGIGRTSGTVNIIGSLLNNGLPVSAGINNNSLVHDVLVSGTGTLTVHETTSFNNSVTVTGTNQLFVNEICQTDGATTLAVGRVSGTVNIIGSLLNNGLPVSAGGSSNSLVDNVLISGTGTLTVHETTSFNNSVSLTGTNQLFVNEISPLDVLGVNNTTTFAGNLHVMQHLSVVSSASFQNDVTISGGLFNPSDERIKVAIKEIDPQESLDKILGLTPKTFKFSKEWREILTHEQQEQRGFIAQEVKKIIPEIVKVSPCRTASDTILDDFHQLEYQKLVVDLVGALKATHAKFEKLSQACGDRIAKLEKRICELESKNP